jgi:hypothetical protein
LIVVGPCFEELAEAEEFAVYEKYALDVLSPASGQQLELLLRRPEVSQDLTRDILHNSRGMMPGVLEPGLWIRIDLIRIRIQHFCSIRIRIQIQAKTELSKTISFSNFF